jgi:hypothetical protein
MMIKVSVQIESLRMSEDSQENQETGLPEARESEKQV